MYLYVSLTKNCDGHMHGIHVEVISNTTQVVPESASENEEL